MALAMEDRESPTVQDQGECLMGEVSRWFERIWDQKLSSSLMLVPFMTVPLF